MTESRITPGLQAVTDIMEGKLSKATSPYLRQVQADVAAACEELIEVGARVRPLYDDERQIGWVRGVHLAERKHLGRWIEDPVDLGTHIVRLGTTLAPDVIDALSATEMRSLLRVVESMTRSDMRLFPFLSAFVTTSVSEQLWYGQGTQLTGFRDREIHLPDGQCMRVLTASEHARLWATLCNYRETAKRRIDANWNALTIVQPLAGRGSSRMVTELKKASRALVPDAIDAWRETVRDARAEINFADGWGHSGQDDTPEGLLREMQGMAKGDKHEQFVQTWEQAQKDAAEAQLRQIEARRAARPPAEREKVEYLTEAQVYGDRVRRGRPQTVTSGPHGVGKRPRR